MDKIAFKKDVTIIGGGFSGTMLAVQLLRRSPGWSVAIIDQSPVPAQGLAYGTEQDCHLLNVPAGGMSAFPTDPDHFLRWAQGHHDSRTLSSSFLPRALYGRYLSALLNEARTSASANLEWIRDEALSLSREHNGFVIHRKNGPPLFTQSVILAMGNFPPGDLGISGMKDRCQHYVRLAWSKEALGGLSANDDVLLIGSGLTAVDIAISLHAARFQGKIHILSRHGLIPHVHSDKPYAAWPPFWNEDSPRTTRGLLHLIRKQVEAASAAGYDWRAVMDSLRPLVQQIWKSLPLKERRRFLRHARPYWEIHRHKVAPEIGRTFLRMIATGQIEIHAGWIANYSEMENTAEVTFRNRSTDRQQTLRVARVINCSGPATDCRKIDSPFLDSLFAQGLVRQDSLSLSMDTDENGSMLDLNGRPSQGLYTIGPARKGRLWESTAVPELRVQAAALADHLLNNELRSEGDSPEMEPVELSFARR
jgi:uncharacterized NAD(P)/FAD-binding protein YdhS